MAKKVNKTNGKGTEAKGKKTVALTVEQKNKLLLSLCVFVAVCILATLVFGLKLYAYGRDVKVVYIDRSKPEPSQLVGDQIVEVCKKYKLKTLKDTTGDGKEFLYWSTNGEESGRVSMSGIWLESTDNIILYAVWSEGEWTENF